MQELCDVLLLKCWLNYTTSPSLDTPCHSVNSSQRGVRGPPGGLLSILIASLVSYSNFIATPRQIHRVLSLLASWRRLNFLGDVLCLVQTLTRSFQDEKWNVTSELEEKFSLHRGAAEDMTVSRLWQIPHCFCSVATVWIDEFRRFSLELIMDHNALQDGEPSALCPPLLCHGSLHSCWVALASVDLQEITLTKVEAD